MYLHLPRMDDLEDAAQKSDVVPEPELQRLTFWELLIDPANFVYAWFVLLSLLAIAVVAVYIFVLAIQKGLNFIA